MLNYFGKEYDYSQLCERVSTYSRLAGTKSYTLNSGKSKGVDAVDIRTGSGLSYTVVADRGLDIAWAEYKGVPISYISAAGVVSPAYYEAKGDEWLRGFYGGLLTTCGLTQVGDPCEFNGAEHGLHGRVANTPAERICIDEQVDGGEYVISVKGVVRQAKSCAENMVLSRSIQSIAGRSRIVVEDVIENKSYKKQPFMILYHCNIGFPLLNENTGIFIPNRKVTSMFPQHEPETADYGKTESPKDDYEERVFYFDALRDSDGFSRVIVANDRQDPSLALIIRYKADTLDNLALWKQYVKGEYVIGIEPCNNHILGVRNEYSIGTLKYLNPLEIAKTFIEFEFIDDREKLDKILFH